MESKEDTIIDIKQKISWSCWLACNAFLYHIYTHLTSQLQAHFCFITGVFIFRIRQSVSIMSRVASASLPWQVFFLSGFMLSLGMRSFIVSCFVLFGAHLLEASSFLERNCRGEWIWENGEVGRAQRSVRETVRVYCVREESICNVGERGMTRLSFSLAVQGWEGTGLLFTPWGNGDS